jgi:glycine oxidase
MAVLGTYDVVVIGGGACGATTAYFLRQEGVSVALAEKGIVGREASWASAGMIGPESCPVRDPWFLAATTMSKELYDRLESELLEQTGRKIGYGGEGHLLIARNEEAVADLHARAEERQEKGVEIQFLSGTEAREREPALPDDVLEAAWKPQGRFLDARNYTATIGLAARKNGVDIYEGFQASSLVWDGDRVIGVRAGNEELHAGIVINAAGAWAGGIDPRLTHPVYPLHGQIMSVAGPTCGLRHNVSCAGDAAFGYVTPRSDGRVLIGATHDDWGFRKKITPEGIKYLGKIVDQVLPCLVGQPVLDIWSGLRPGTADGLATLGPDPRISGGYLWGAGHASSGIMQMPATAAVLTDLVAERPPRIAIDQLGIERYLGDDGTIGFIRRKGIEKRFLSI